MSGKNFERMIRLAEEVFDVRNDPSQLAITPEVMDRLRRLHPATLSEEATGDGPVAWIVAIPTTRQAMDLFVAGNINERVLLEETREAGTFESIYLCSALVLPEYRGNGLAKRLITGAVDAIMRDHPIQHLFFWSFSAEGEKLAESVSRSSGLTLLKRKI